MFLLLLITNESLNLGCYSGIGLFAAQVLALSNSNHCLILVGRNREKAEMAKKTVMSATSNTNGNNLVPMVCDHASIKSVREFAAQLRAHCQSRENSLIDVLCLNAATLHDSNTPQYTDDGLEKTFQTNHLAPFLIVNLCHDLISKNGRIVVTGSGLHYRKTFGDFEGLIDSATGVATKSFTTVDGGVYDAKSAYSSSKLCNVAFTLALNRRLAQRREGTVVNCFTPGLVPQTGLFRGQGTLRLLLFTFAMNMSNMTSPIEWGGGALAWMAVADEAGKRGGEYWKTPTGASLDECSFGKDFCPVPPSDEALSETNQEKLWKLTSQLAGIPADII